MIDLTVVVGGMWGSEGKGAVVGHLSRSLPADALVIRVAGPNAGHTVVGADGEIFKLRQIPVAAITSQCELAIAEGSEIDIQVLSDELVHLEKSGYTIGQRLSIHPSATVMHSSDQATEKSLVGRIGSTGKGIGSARARRIMRTAVTAGELGEGLLGSLASAGVKSLPSVQGFNWRDRSHVVIEGTQGFGLGLHTPYYPNTTSSDCRAIDFLAMAGISPWDRNVDSFRVWVAMRVFPIRVAGNSGPMLGETTWAELGLPEERTTVTDKVRRVGMWDSHLAREAVLANGGSPVVRVALMMADQKFPELRRATTMEQLTSCTPAMDFIRAVESDTGAQVGLMGTGPDTLVEVGGDGLSGLEGWILAQEKQEK